MITSPLGRIRRAAEAFCPKDDDTRPEIVTKYVRSLVTLAAIKGVQNLLQEPATERDKCSELDLELAEDMHVAAVHLGQKEYVERRIAEGVRFCNAPSGRLGVQSTVFGSGFIAAAAQGDLGMIKLLLSSDDEYKDDGTLRTSLRHIILLQASIHGYRAAFDFALEMWPLILPEDTVRRRDRYANAVGAALRATPWPHYYKRLADILGPDSRMFTEEGIGCPTAWLTRSAMSGHEQMVRYFLDNGAIPNHPRAYRNAAPGTYRYMALPQAIRRGHETIVKILLDAGADPNWYSLNNTALMEAVLRGSVAMVKLLLEHSADVNEGCPPPIVIAVFKEHPDMFRLLREHGARLDTPETGGWAMALARLYELDSMVDLLVREGVGEDVILHHVRSLGEARWCYYRFWPRWARYEPRRTPAYDA